jgi:hypothetical protein
MRHHLQRLGCSALLSILSAQANMGAAASVLVQQGSDGPCCMEGGQA